MDILMEAGKNLLSTHSQERPVSRLFLFFLLGIAAAIALIYFFSYEASSVQPVMSDAHHSQQVTRQEVAERYRDPSLSYFFGQ